MTLVCCIDQKTFVGRRRTVGAGEGSLALVIGMDRNLMITRVPIEVAKVRVLCQPFKHLIDEGKREVIFLGCLVKHPVIDTHSPSGHCPSRYELVPLIADHRHASLLVTPGL